MTDRRQPLHVLDIPARVVDVAGAHQGGPLVDGALEDLERDTDAVRAADELDLDTAVREREPGVAVGREVDVGHDDLRTLRVAEGRGDRHQRRGDARLQRHLAGVHAQHAREVPVQRLVLADPVVVPGPSPELGPLASELPESDAPSPRERRERARVEVVEPLGDRELGAPGAFLRGHQPIA